MTPTYDKVHYQFKLNGLHFNYEELKELAYNFIKEGEPYEKIIGDFLADWLSDKSYLEVKTSGSTGIPKTIQLKKQAMVNSAIATGDFFNLRPGDKALHCLPCHYIAGKMMLVRALILGLDLDVVEPTSQLIFDHQKNYDFCAMVPLQLQHAISYADNIKTIIVGGSKVSLPLLEKIKTSSSRFYETYGMTETVTHVAVRQLQSKTGVADNYFNALPNVRFNIDERNCLMIKAPKLVNAPLVTNDVVDLKSKTSFKLLGRYDNVVNSGGVKLFPEQIEEKLQSLIKERYIIASESDDVLGEKLILIIENPTSSIDRILSQLQKLKSLDKFEIPKHIYTTKKFIETSTGKIQRKKTMESVLS